ncbi:MAG: glycosyltransferase family 39 protein [Bdellovibrionota bacterium]
MTQNIMSNRKRLGTLSILLICIFALWLRAPYISSGLPYFYDEDEAHHFNRVADMVKAGEYDPKYFRKPSLHFYLRMPVVAVSFLWGVSQGHIKSIKELTTRDPYGIADYAFSTSHPGIVKWNRAFSVLLSLATVLLTILITYELSASWFASSLAGAITAVSPDLLNYSATIGVDGLMAFMCLAVAFFALRAAKFLTLSKLIYCGLLAGLAISSKYNAAPIYFVPLALIIHTRRYTFKYLLAAVLAPIVGFFIGSPYILSSLPLFLDHFAYEIWHYGIAGHEGHTANPGSAQFMFYLSWLYSSAIGVAALIAAFFGLVGFLRSGNLRLVFLTFPVLFFILMISQKANFTRNMLVIIPFAAVFCGIFFRKILQLISSERNALFAAAATILFIIPLIQPFANAIDNRSNISAVPETRIDAMSWLGKHSAKFNKIAVAGELQFAPEVYKISGVSRVSEQDKSLLDFYLQGFNLVVLSNKALEATGNKFPYKIETKFQGNAEIKRLVKNPSFSMLSFKGHEDEYAPLARKALYTNSLYNLYVDPDISPLGLKGRPCSNQANGETNPNEPYCWIQSKLALLKFLEVKELGQAIDHEGNITLFIESMSPWADQEVSLSVGGKYGVQFLISEPGKWQSFPYKIPFPIFLNHGAIEIEVAKIASPKSSGLNNDTRSLGLAIRNVSVGPSVF